MLQVSDYCECEGGEVRCNPFIIHTTEQEDDEEIIDEDGEGHRVGFCGSIQYMSVRMHSVYSSGRQPVDRDRPVDL